MKAHQPHLDEELSALREEKDSLYEAMSVWRETARMLEDARKQLHEQAIRIAVLTKQNEDLATMANRAIGLAEHLTKTTGQSEQSEDSDAQTLLVTLEND